MRRDTARTRSRTALEGGDDDQWYDIVARVTPVSLGKGVHEFIVVLRSEQGDLANA